MSAKLSQNERNEGGADERTVSIDSRNAKTNSSTLR